MVCRNCGTEIADKAIVCYRCGTSTADPVRKPVEVRRRRIPVPLRLVIFAVALIIGAILLAILIHWSYQSYGLEDFVSFVPRDVSYSLAVLIDFPPIHA